MVNRKAQPKLLQRIRCCVYFVIFIVLVAAVSPINSNPNRLLLEETTCDSSFDRHGGIVVYTLILIYMFWGLAIMCEHYFVASLEQMVERLNISADLAGATFMAAGTSAPELFTSAVGLFVSKNAVGVGGVVGSTLFNHLVIVGCASFLAGSFRIDQFPMFRDLLFYAVSCVFVGVVMFEHAVPKWLPFVMLGTYIGYCVLATYTKDLMKWYRKKHSCRDELKIVAYVGPAGKKARSISFEEESRLLERVYLHDGSYFIAIDSVADDVDGEDNAARYCARLNVGREGLDRLLTGAQGHRERVCSFHRGNKTAQKFKNVLFKGYLYKASLNVLNGYQKRWCFIADNKIHYCSRMNHHVIPFSTIIAVVTNVSNRSIVSFDPASPQLLSPEDNGEYRQLYPVCEPKQKQKQVFYYAKVCDPEDTQSPTRNQVTINNDDETEEYPMEMNYATEEDRLMSHEISNPSTMADDEFELRTLFRDFRFKAHSSQEVDMWVGALRHAIDMMPPADLDVHVDDEEYHGLLEVPDSWVDRIPYILSWPMVALFYYTVPDCNRPGWQRWYPVTFVVATAWQGIMVFLMVYAANKAGCFLGISSMTMGLTIVALGTSLPDCMASLIVAKSGGGMMATANAFGSNIFDVDIGLGFVWALSIIFLPSLPIDAGADDKKSRDACMFVLFLMVVCLFLYAILLIVNRMRTFPVFGIVMVLLYCVFLIYSFLSEANRIPPIHLF